MLIKFVGYFFLNFLMQNLLLTTQTRKKLMKMILVGCYSHSASFSEKFLVPVESLLYDIQQRDLHPVCTVQVIATNIVMEEESVVMQVAYIVR